MEFETDITGYGRKMGRDAGLTPEGRLDGVHKLGGTSGVYNEGLQPSNTIQARTMNPGGSETSGGGANSGDFAPTEGRADGAIGNPRGWPSANQI
tara:strand:- start:1736 stop:2020 length:285 start_codon:yes stop_codon:yes gene_type:complete